MHIGNRIFPYPVLNRNEALSDYVEDSVFKVEFDVDESGAPIVQNGEVVFKNLHYTITDDPYELAKFVIENPLRFRELTWRSFSSEKMIVIGTLKAEMRVMGEYPQAEENTKHFAEIAKSLSKLGSVMLLDCMTEKDIEEYVYKKYKRMIEEDLANRGLFDKLKDAVIKVFK